MCPNQRIKRPFAALLWPTLAERGRKYGVAMLEYMLGTEAGARRTRTTTTRPLFHRLPSFEAAFMMA